MGDCSTNTQTESSPKDRYRQKLGKEYPLVTPRSQYETSITDHDADSLKHMSQSERVLLEAILHNETLHPDVGVLSKSKRTVIATRMTLLPGVSSKSSSRILGVSQHSVQHGVHIMKDRPDLFLEVETGGLTIDKAYGLVDEGYRTRKERPSSGIASGVPGVVTRHTSVSILEKFSEEEYVWLKSLYDNGPSVELSNLPPPSRMVIACRLRNYMDLDGVNIPDGYIRKGRKMDYACSIVRVDNKGTFILYNVMRRDPEKFLRIARGEESFTKSTYNEVREYVAPLKNDVNEKKNRRLSDREIETTKNRLIDAVSALQGLSSGLDTFKHVLILRDIFSPDELKTYRGIMKKIRASIKKFSNSLGDNIPVKERENAGEVKQ